MLPEKKQADSVMYNILFITHEYDFDLGCGFAGEVTLNIYD